MHQRPLAVLIKLLFAAPLVLCETAWAAESTEPLSSETATLPALTVKGKREVSTATRKDEDPLRLPFSTSVVQRQSLDESGAISLEDSMRSIPGLQHGTQGNYFTRFETRGMRDTQDVLVLVDGVPLRLLQGNSDVTLVAPDLVERIEFVKGPASALYGKNAIGGVAQFFMKPEREGGSASVTVGSFGRLDGAYRQRIDYDRGSVFVGLSYSSSDGFQNNTERTQPSGVLGIDHAMTENWTTGVQYLATKVKAYRGSTVPLQNGKPMYGITQSDNYAIPGVYVEGEYQSFAWKNNLRLSNGWSMKHLSSYSMYDRLFQGGVTVVPGPTATSKGYSETDTADRALFHDLGMTHEHIGKGWKNALQFGLNIEHDWQNQASPSFSNAPTYAGPDYTTPVTNILNDPRGIRGPVTSSRFRQDVRSVYLQDRIEVGDYGLVLGLRHDSFEQKLSRSDTSVESSQSASRLTPRIGADWIYARRGDSAHSVFANWGEGFRPQAVALNTRSGVVVPAILKPELTRSVEFGIKGRIDEDRWNYQVSLFRSDKIDGQRSYRNGPDSFVFSNATSRTQGVESSVQWRLAKDWSGYAHYTWQDAKLLDFQTYSNSGVATENWGGNRVRMSAQNIAGAGLTYSKGLWLWTASVNYVGTRYLRDNVANPQKLPAYALINSSVSYRIDPKFTLQAGVNNLGNVYYISDDMSSTEAGNAGAPRNYFARLRYDF
jgi:outer membrane receptor protein involved in Fe transport